MIIIILLLYEKKYLEKIKNVADLVYKERELITIINRKYSEYHIEKLFSSKYAIWNYIDMFNHLYDISNKQIDEKDLIDIVLKYDKSGDFVLRDLALFTRNSIGVQDNNDTFKRSSINA